ncbi:MAG: class I SAM-dependent methyltransferase, partial [Ruminiclostridium sp.]|nr:class I SAM-dependent methyltransferase [Ruminiclostridium sp.]
MELRIFEKLNPSQLTAGACLLGGAANGDEYCAKILERLMRIEDAERDRITKNDVTNDEIYKISSLYAASIWAKSLIVDKLFFSYRMSAFMDIGCGYNRRGLVFAKKGFIEYYGIDLPPVIEKMKTIAAHDGISYGSKIHYFAADATDPAALRRAVYGDSPLFITTEGLMMYLTEPEMLTVVDNISALLAEFGGVWVTGDSEDGTVNTNMMKLVLKADDVDADMLKKSVFSEEWKKLINDNSFISLKGEEQKKFFEEHGLNCKKVSVSGYLFNIDVPAAVKKAYEGSHILVLTPVRLSGSTSRSPSLFSIDEKNDGGKVTFMLNGRLDTVTAPQLVETFERVFAEKGLMSIVLDMSGC